MVYCFLFYFILFCCKVSEIIEFQLYCKIVINTITMCYRCDRCYRGYHIGLCVVFLLHMFAFGFCFSLFFVFIFISIVFIFCLFVCLFFCFVFFFFVVFYCLQKPLLFLFFFLSFWMKMFLNETTIVCFVLFVLFGLFVTCVSW